MTTEFTCEFCNNNFSSERDLSRHKKRALYCLKLQSKKIDVFKCEYCSKTFSNRYVLQKHQSKTLSCLKIQKELNNVKQQHTCENCGSYFARLTNLRRHEKTCGDKYTCGICNREFSRLFNLQRHEKSCINLTNDEFVTLNDTVKEIQRDLSRDKKKTKLELLAELNSISEDYMKDCLEHLSLCFIENGAQGLATYANTYPFNGNVICTDRTRRKLNYWFDKDKYIRCDTGLPLSQKFFETIRDKSIEIIDTEYMNIIEQIQDIHDDDTKFQLIEKATHLQNISYMCDEAAKGNINSLSDDFIKYFTRLLPRT